MLWLALAALTGCGVVVWVMARRLAALRAQLEAEQARAATQRAELQRATGEAQAASRAKSDFLARMSHEIRTPMHGVIGMTQLLLESRLSEQQRAYADMIRSSANALLLIVNDILDFSKVEAGRLSLDPVDFELPSVVDEVVTLMRVQAEAKDLSLVLLRPPDLPERVHGDPGRLRQVLINLIGNALKFTERGEVVLEVAVLSAEPAELRFSVRDTGVGMGADQLAQIFEPFQQADGSSTRHHDGTGLGLTISRELVELMGGRITVTSEVGVGSTFAFEITLPGAEAPAETPAPDAQLLDLAGRTAGLGGAGLGVTGRGPGLISARSGSADQAGLPELPDGYEPTARLHGMRALLLTEGHQRDSSLPLRLKALGLRVERVASVDAALTTLRADAAGPDPVRLCLLDVLQVDEPALDLARLVTTDSALGGVVPVLLASETEGVSSAEVERAGFAAFLEQPMDQKLLAEGLRAALGIGELRRTRGARRRTLMVTRHSVVAQQRSSQERVLLAEDNRINQVIAVKLLERQGLRVDVVADGRAAVAAAQQRPYAAIFMDCLMPEMDGFEATAAIRAHEAAEGRSPVPIIAMTASAMAGDRNRTEQAGMNAFLAKPIEHGAIERVLARWLPGRRSLLARTRRSGPRRIDLPVDVTVLGNLKRAGGPEVVRVAVELFLEAGETSLADIEAAIAAGDPDEIRLVVHRFKGSCGSVGARAMARICSRMEQASGAGPLILEGELAELQGEFKRVAQALRTYRASGSGAFQPENVGD